MFAYHMPLATFARQGKSPPTRRISGHLSNRCVSGFFRLAFETMKNNIAGKVLFAFFVAVLLVLTMHKAAAADLGVLPALPATDKDLRLVRCENMKDLLIERPQSQRLLNEKVTRYLSEAAQGFWQWHQELAVYEGKTNAWSIGFFQPLRDSEENLELSSQAVYTTSGGEEEWLADVRTQIEACYPESDARQQVIEKLDQYTDMQAEHLPAVADFLSTMKMRLKDWLVVWEKLEGTTEALPVGYFEPLTTESEIFREAADLARENASFVEEQYTLFLQDFLALAGLTAPQVD